MFEVNNQNFIFLGVSNIRPNSENQGVCDLPSISSQHVWKFVCALLPFDQQEAITYSLDHNSFVSSRFGFYYLHYFNR